MRISLDELHRCDIARMNLLCATGLPGAERLDIDRCLYMLDKYASRVESETRRHLYRVADPRYAAHYHNSPVRFRVEMMAQTLFEDCGVRYNSNRVRSPDFRNSKDLFIHGMIEDANGGTCASLPILYAAVGRRLRYPIKIVAAKGHLFCRWDSADCKLNFEVGGAGYAYQPDDYYKRWPRPISDEEISRGEFLTSMSPARDLATCLEARGYCLEDTGRIPEAIQAYENSCRLDPTSYKCRAMLDRLKHPKPKMVWQPRFVPHISRGTTPSALPTTGFRSGQR